jgi:hypothetical protein
MIARTSVQFGETCAHTFRVFYELFRAIHHALFLQKKALGSAFSIQCSAFGVHEPEVVHTYFFRRKRFARKVVATRVEAFFDEVGVHPQEILHLSPKKKEIKKGKKRLLERRRSSTTNLLFIYHLRHVRLLGRVELREIHGMQMQLLCPRQSQMKF